MRLAPTLALAVLLLSPVAPASATVPEPGVYTTLCLPTVACTTKIRKTGKNRYFFEWEASTRDGKKVYCRYKASLKPGTGKHRDGPIEDVLVGTLAGTKDEILIAGMAGDQIWQFVDNNLCEDVKLPNGIIGINGMYDNEPEGH
jgi:hypothetical protein